MMSSTRVVGSLWSGEFHKAKQILEGLGEHFPELVERPHCLPLMNCQWDDYVDQMRKEHGGNVWSFSGCVAVYINDELIGDLPSLLQWVVHHHGNIMPETDTFYERLGRDEYNTHIHNPHRDFVFMDVSIEGDPIGRLVFELYKDLCPRTCANFVSLCTGEKGKSPGGTHLSYMNSIFHRVVPNGWIQGGDICGGSGAKGESIYGNTFEDESFAVSHNAPGMLGMSNSGRNTNNSQFYITLKPSLWMDKLYVAFGCLVEGKEILKKLEATETYNGRPNRRCQISNCGRLGPLSD